MTMYGNYNWDRLYRKSDMQDQKDIMKYQADLQGPRYQNMQNLLAQNDMQTIQNSLSAIDNKVGFGDVLGHGFKSLFTGKNPYEENKKLWQDNEKMKQNARQNLVNLMSNYSSDPYSELSNMELNAILPDSYTTQLIQNFLRKQYE